MNTCGTCISVADGLLCSKTPPLPPKGTMARLRHLYPHSFRNGFWDPVYSDQSDYACYWWGQKPPAERTQHCRWCCEPFAVQIRPGEYRTVTCERCGGGNLIAVNYSVDIEIRADKRIPPSEARYEGSTDQSSEGAK